MRLGCEYNGVVGEASTGREALALCLKLRPDLALLDVRMPEMDGLEATRAIKAEMPEVGVLIVTMHENPDYLFEAVKAGAAGYVLNDASRQELLGAVRGALRGEALLAPELAGRLLRQLARQDAGRDAGLVVRLTPREREVLQLLAEGLTNREIAARLVVGTGTIKGYVENIIRKLGVFDRTQAAVRAIQMGLVHLTE